MVRKTRKQLLKDLEELKDIIEFSRLYLANYFSELRNEVDKEFISILMHHHGDEQIKTNLNQSWKKMIEHINSFEEQCINTTVDLTENEERINSIETTLNESTESIQEMIDIEEYSLMKLLFQNKTIVYLDAKHILKKYKSNTNAGKLILLDGETIRKKKLQKRR